ncbi:hypothetical protein J3E69DRAFT_106954 [Trichoderma sp. SZMC 28015]
MCTYILILYHCGCYGSITCHTSCAQIMSEIHRINEPEAWQGEGLNQLPFHMDDECGPWWHNTIVVQRAAFCDQFWENRCPSEQRAAAWPGYN